jgi:hypothetical protein
MHDRNGGWTDVHFRSGSGECEKPKSEGYAKTAALDCALIGSTESDFTASARMV